MSTRATVTPASCRIDAEQLCARLGVWMSCTGTPSGRTFKVLGEIVMQTRTHEKPDWDDAMERIKEIVKRKRGLTDPLRRGLSRPAFVEGEG